MTAIRKILVEEEPLVTETVTRAPKLRLVPPAEVREPEEARNALIDVVLFFMAPFIGLVYVITLPFVGLAAVAVLAARFLGKIEAVAALGTAVKTVGFFVAAPFVGLAYVIAFPFIGLATLAWLGGRAALVAAR